MSNKRSLTAAVATAATTTNKERPVALGASEFAAILNGSDPLAVLKALQRFCRIVRRERRIALADKEQTANDDNESSDNDDNDDDDGDEEERNQKRFRKDESWKEDTANYSVPFVGTSFARRQETIVPGEWPTGFLKAYLEKSPLALELTSEQLIPQHSALHKTLLRRKMGRTSHKLYEVYLEALAELATAGPPFIKELVRRRLPDLFALLKEETANGKGKAGVLGGCGALAVPVLRILARLPARYVVRSSLTLWRFLLKASKTQDETTPREKARAACFDLVTKLCRQKEGEEEEEEEEDVVVVLASLCTPGVRDRKIPPGMLFVALKDGLAGLGDLVDTKNDFIVEAAERLLKALRSLLQQYGASNRSLLDVFSRESIQGLCQLAAKAPSLTSVDDSSSSAAVEARRVLFLLVSDPKHSPLLQANARAHSRQFIVQALLNLVDENPSAAMQELVLEAITATPSLFSLFFRGLTIPDWKKSSFSFLSRLHLASRLMQQGPSATQCLSHDHQEKTVMSAILPWALQKAIVRKALQSSQPLIVAETLKILLLAMKRFTQLRSEGSIPELDAWMINEFLPAATTVLAVLSIAPVVAYRACLLLTAMHEAFPTLWKDVSFDWTKFLSNNFEKAPLYLQRTLLQTLSCLLGEVFLSPAAQLKCCRDLLKIVLGTNSNLVWEISRELTIKHLSRMLATAEEYELSCWIDGMTTETLNEFFTVLQNTSGLGSLLLFANAWQQVRPGTTVPSLPASPLLIQALQFLPRASEEFATLVGQIAFKSLLFIENPIALAIFLQQACQALREHESNASCSIVKKLGEYAKFLIGFSVRFVPLEDSELFSISVMLGLHSNDAQTPSPIPRRLCFVDALVLVRQLTHLIAVAGDSDLRVRMMETLRRLIPVVVSRRGIHQYTDSIFQRLQVCLLGIPPLEMKAVNLVISSAVHGDPRASMGKDSTGLADIFDESVSGRANVKESALLSLFLSAPFIPPAQLSTGLKTLLEMKLDPSERERVSPLILKFLDVFELSSAVAGMEGSKEDIRLSVETIRALVNEWVKTSELERGVVSSSVRERIERLLASFLDKESILSTFVQIALRDHPVDSIIVRCIEGSGEKRLLSSLIETDTLRFGREFFKCLVSMPADGQEQFENGSFDRPMFLFLRSDLEIENEDTFSRWKNSIVSRTVRSLPLWASTNDSPSYLSNTVSLLLDLMRLDAIGASMLGSLAAPLASFVKNKVRTQHLEQGVIPAPTATVLECAVLLCCLDSSENSMTLSSESLLCLCELIPRSLRYHVRGKSSGKVSYLPTPAKILQWTLKLLDRVERYDPGSFISSGGSAFTTMIRSCLRYGLTREKSSLSPETSQLCIRTVKSFVETVSNDSEDWIQLYPSSSLAVPVAEMLTSHSQFHSTLCEAPDSILKLESIKLLLACYESIENPDFDLSLWKTLLQSFYAGVGETDLSIRQLLFKFGSMEKEVMKMDQLRWGDLTAGSSSRDPWDWLVNAIDTSRINSTLHDFPVNDSIDPSAALSSSTTTADAGRAKELRLDNRYSPGFLLPLVLSALEYTLGYDTGADSNNGESGDLVSRLSINSSGVALAHRLCEKGAIALSLAALCSDCEIMRRVSVSILGLVTVVLHSEAARNASEWRDRPQISMILESVQRALAHHAAENADKEAVVPKLPGVSAIFLAKAFQIILRPGDRLYATVNRVFLRIQKNHGAFQDLWRLPIFISLLCSSADEPEQVAIERVWALHLLNDGFLDQSCYKPLLSCHGAELLFTTLDNLRLHPSNDKHGEYSLLLQTLEVVMRRGGERCHLHFVDRMGLLSFMRSLVMSRPFLGALRSAKTRISFLKLSAITFEKARLVLSQDDFARATIGFAQYLLDFCLQSKVDCRDEKDAATLVSQTSSVLFALTSLPSGSEDDGGQVCAVGPLRPDGLHLETASDFISVVDPSDRPLAIAAICSLPLKCGFDDESNAISFCCKLLQLGQTIEQQQKNSLQVAVIVKVSKILSFFGNSVEGSESSTSLLLPLLKLRKSCARNRSSYREWVSCVRLVVREGADDARTLGGANNARTLEGADLNLLVSCFLK